MVESSIRAVVKGVGSYLPAKCMTNDEIATIVETSDEWVRARTGITRRYIAAEGEYTSDMAAKAAKVALENAGLTPEDIDLIIVATTTPDNTFPSVATKVQALLGVSPCAAFDVQAVCTGFIYGLTTANHFLQSGQYKHALVIGADTMSRIIDWQDRKTCILFGDGAGAVVLSAEHGSDRGVIATYLSSDGRTKDLLYVDGGPSLGEAVGKLRMEGKEVFKYAVAKMTEATSIVLDAAQVTLDEVDWVVPHQANQRILDSVIKKMGVKPEKLIATVDKHANTSAASIPLAIDSAVKDGMITPGNLLALQAIGGGLTWGACLLRW